jgi:hypothetical protein
MKPEPCVGCGGEFLPQEGPVHRYMTSSPACWAAFGRVLAAEYSDSSLMGVHRLSVDAYAVQHPGDGSRQAIQSVGLHLARLHVQLDRQLGADEANAFMLSAAARKAGMLMLRPPPAFPITVAQVAPFAGTAGHERAVREWAQSAWDAWAHAHDLVIGFTAAVLRRP